MRYIFQIETVLIIWGIGLVLHATSAHSQDASSEAHSISGRIKIAPECMKTENQYAVVFLSAGKELLQQVEVPPEGTFEFTITPAAHVVTAASEKGCVTRVEIAASSAESPIELRLAKSKREPSTILWGPESVRPSGNCMCVSAPCNCPIMPTYPSYIYPPIAWPAMYASMWSGFYMPGPMIGGWLNPGYYPGRGHIGFAKPNVYLEKTDSARSKPLQVEMKVKLVTDATWLATAPAHGNSGWNISLEHVDKNTSRMTSDGAHYRFLYYDFRANEDSLQFTSGFCGERHSLLDRMKSTLKDLGFQPNEVADFDDHWKLKLPNSHACVFPQGAHELEAVAKFELQPRPAKITRVVFVVVPKSEIDAKSLDLLRAEPKKAWLRTTAVEKLMTPSAQDGKYNIREWGVAFFFAPAKTVDPAKSVAEIK